MATSHHYRNSSLEIRNQGAPSPDRSSRPGWKGAVYFFALLVAATSLISSVLAGPGSPGASLEQIRNGSADAPLDPPDWQNGNAGASNAHYAESYSIAYRCIMTDLPTSGPDSVITLTIGYDIKHSGANAIDFLTHFQRLGPHEPTFVHLPSNSGPESPSETIDPTEGFSALGYSRTSPDSTIAITEPNTSSPSPATLRFAYLPADEKVLSLWGGTFVPGSFAYVSEGDLATDKAETIVQVSFTATDATAILAWGGHIAAAMDWGDGNSAANVNGSPYHMRLINWTLGNLGNQDRSLSASAVEIPPPSCALDCAEQTVCVGDAVSCCIVASGGAAPYQYSWSGPGTDIVLSSDPCLSIPSAGLDLNAAPMVATVTDYRDVDSKEECSFVVNVQAPPTSDAGADQAKCEDVSGTTTFSLAGTNSNATSQLWEIEGTTGTADATIVSPEAGTTDVEITGIGTVTLKQTAWGAAECDAATDFIDLAINAQPSCTIDNPVTANELTGTISGGAGPYACEAQVIGAGGTNWVVDGCTMTSATTYRVDYHVNGPGADAEATFEVTITDSADPPCTTTCQKTLAPQRACATSTDLQDACGSASQFCVEPTEGFGPFSATWTDPAGAVTTQENLALNEEFCIDVTQAGCYQAVIEDALGFASDPCPVCAVIAVGSEASCP